MRSGFAERELKLRKKDGGALVADVSALLLADDEERPAGMIWRVHDLTERRRGDAERKRLQARLLHTERLSALGEMAARIAHEVRNPLVSIGAAAQVVAEELGAASPVAGEVRRHRARGQAARRASSATFLKFARPRRAELRQCDLAGVVDETAALVRAKAPETKLELNLERPLAARCDPDAIKQVLLNVLLNAVEAAPTIAAELGSSVTGRPWAACSCCRWPIAGRASPIRCGGACSIPSSRPRRAAPASGWRCRSRSSTSTTDAFACSTGAAAARALSSSCR